MRSRNRDVRQGVNFQPVSLTGRIPEEDRRKLRYTPERLGVRPRWKRRATSLATTGTRCPSCRRSRNSCRSSRTPPSRRSRRTRRAARVVPVPREREGPGADHSFVDVEGLMEDLWLLAQDTKEKKIQIHVEAQGAAAPEAALQARGCARGHGPLEDVENPEPDVHEKATRPAAEFSWPRCTWAGCTSRTTTTTTSSA